MNERFDLTPVALYARVSSDRQDVDLSVTAQLQGAPGLRREARLPGRPRVRGRGRERPHRRRPEFQKMLNEAAKPEAPFKEILVWKFSRFTRKREHAVAFKSMLRRRGIRVVSITEQADDTPTGKLLEAIIESVDEFYSENLAQRGCPGDAGGRVERLLDDHLRTLRLQAGPRPAWGREAPHPGAEPARHTPWSGGSSTWCSRARASST